MKNLFCTYCLAFILVGLAGCEDPLIEDVIPPSFSEKTLLNPDDIYLYNVGSDIGVRLDPLVNDSIKVDVSVSYSIPEHGTITFIQNEGWFYKPEPDFFGQDHITYTICYDDVCSSAPITMHVEAPLDLNNCSFQINGEEVETLMDQPIAIRIFENDIVCPYMGSSIRSPEKGTFTTYSYSGSFKNIVYVYIPPKGFVGTDTFRYKLFTDGADIEAWCTITVK